MPTTDGQEILSAFDLPPEKAIEKLKGLGISVTGDWNAMMADAESRAFVLAKITQADLLETVKSELERALEEGIPFEQFKRDMRQRIVRRGWTVGDEDDETGQATAVSQAWRLEVIYRTNLQSALMAGRYIAQQETIKERPYGTYSAIRDRRTTDLCSGLDGIVMPLDDAFWGMYYPPNHFRCRARVTTLSQREMDRRGLKVADADTLANVGTVSSGFDRLPTDPYTPDMSKYSTAIGKRLEEALTP